MNGRGDDRHTGEMDEQEIFAVGAGRIITRGFFVAQAGFDKVGALFRQGEADVVIHIGRFGLADTFEVDGRIFGIREDRCAAMRGPSG